MSKRVHNIRWLNLLPLLALLMSAWVCFVLPYAVCSAAESAATGAALPNAVGVAPVNVQGAAVTAEWTLQDARAGRERVLLRLNGADAGEPASIVRNGPQSVEMIWPGLLDKLPGGLMVAPPSEAKLFNGIVPGERGLILLLKDPAFGFVVTRPGVGLIQIDLFKNPLGARWEPAVKTGKTGQAGPVGQAGESAQAPVQNLTPPQTPSPVPAEVPAAQAPTQVQAPAAQAPKPVPAPVPAQVPASVPAEVPASALRQPPAASLSPGQFLAPPAAAAGENPAQAESLTPVEFPALPAGVLNPVMAAQPNISDAQLNFSDQSASVPSTESVAATVPGTQGAITPAPATQNTAAPAPVVTTPAAQGATAAGPAPKSMTVDGVRQVLDNPPVDPDPVPEPQTLPEGLSAGWAPNASGAESGSSAEAASGATPANSTGAAPGGAPGSATGDVSASATGSASGTASDAASATPSPGESGSAGPEARDEEAEQFLEWPPMVMPETLPPAPLPPLFDPNRGMPPAQVGGPAGSPTSDATFFQDVFRFFAPRQALAAETPAGDSGAAAVTGEAAAGQADVAATSETEAAADQTAPGSLPQYEVIDAPFIYRSRLVKEGPKPDPAEARIPVLVNVPVTPPATPPVEPPVAQPAVPAAEQPAIIPVQPVMPPVVLPAEQPTAQPLVPAATPPAAQPAAPGTEPGSGQGTAQPLVPAATPPAAQPAAPGAEPGSGQGIAQPAAQPAEQPAAQPAAPGAEQSAAGAVPPAAEQPVTQTAAPITQPIAPVTDQPVTQPATPPADSASQPAEAAAAPGATPAGQGAPVIYVDEQGNPVDPPLEPQAAIIELEQYMSDGDFAAAYEIADKLSRQDNLDRKQREYVLHRRADAMFSQHRDDPAAFFNEIMDSTTIAINFNTRSPRNAEAYLRLGFLQLKANNAYEAEAYFAVLRQQYPRDEAVPLSYYYMGDYQYTQGNLNDAVLQFVHVVQEYPDSRYSRDAALGLTRTLYRLGYYDKAYEVIDYVEKRWPRYYLDYPPVLSVLGDTSYRARQIDRARQAYLLYYNLLPDAPDANIILSRIGDIYLSQKYRGAATYVYEEAVRRFPGTEGGVIAMMRLAENGINDDPTMAGMFKVFQQPYNLGPAEAYRKIIREYPDSPLVPLVKLKLAMWSVWQKDFEAAFQLCNEIVTADPNHPLAAKAIEVSRNAFAMLAAESVNSKRYERVRDAWARYPLLHTQEELLDPDSRLALAVSQWEGGDPDGALRTIEPFFLGTKLPEYSEMALTLALTILVEYDRWQAVEDLADRVSLWEITPPTKRQMDYALGLAYENQGKGQEAMPIWKELYEQNALPPEQQAYADYFLARQAESGNDLESAYHIGQTALQRLKDLAALNPEQADTEKIKTLLGSLMNIAQTSGLLQNALDYGNEYLTYASQGSDDALSVMYNMAALQRQRGSMGEWEKILTTLSTDYPDSYYGKAAASQLSAYRMDRDAAQYAPQGGF